MVTALVVDDGKVDQRLAGLTLEKSMGIQVSYADDGQLALEAIRLSPPDLVVTDLQMPRMDGLELVEAIRHEHPAVPVILMTAHGSEELAAEALRRGAASYVPKRYLARDLAPTARRVLAAADVMTEREAALRCLTHAEVQFVLNNDAAQIPPVVTYLRDSVARLRLCDKTAVVRVGMALDEAICNAIYHGNLGVGSELRQTDTNAYWDLVEQRRQTAPYRDRRVSIQAHFTRDEAVYVIRDQGEGFDPSTLPDPTDPANIEKVSGRGLLLIRCFMDAVRHNAAGNEITMIKRRENGKEEGTKG